MKAVGKLLLSCINFSLQKLGCNEVHHNKRNEINILLQIKTNKIENIDIGIWKK